MKFFLPFLLIFTTLFLSCASLDIINFRIYITNAIEEDIVFHLQSKWQDLGNHTLAFNQEFDWKFPVKIGTYYKAEFWWGSKFQTISVFNYHIFDVCFNGALFTVQRCYWLVRPDGFYYHVTNDTFPGGWTKSAFWSSKSMA
ncbi:plant self-incompatibility S1 [Artemisia annua]|uniref:S-protein homolog n=1 Tax=Artemisia annua TaxID=35608 RepID=A0A2U1LNW2_ARTAN|nr:plant self-incompatibility S1 [Artemisia annua]